MQNEIILVTGANGLLGRHFLMAHNKSSCSLHAIVRKMPDIPVDNVTYHIIDLSSKWLFNSLPSDINTICHLAQSDKFRDFPEKALDVFTVNIASTANLLDFAYRNSVKKFIYASSGGVYANGKQDFKENSPLAESHKLGYYLGSKRCGEILSSNYSSIMNVYILRFFFIYGAQQKRSMLLPRLVDNVKNGNPIILQGNEGLSINPIHVKDAAEALSKCCIIQGNAILNIAGKNIHSLKNIALMIGDLVGRKPIFEYQEKESENMIANIEAMEKQLFSPKINLEKGLLDIL